MKVGRERFQHGSVRKVPRSQGFAWEFRYYSTDPSGERKLKVQTFDSLKHPTEAAVRKAVEPLLGSLNSDTLAGNHANVDKGDYAGFHIRLETEVYSSMHYWQVLPPTGRKPLFCASDCVINSPRLVFP